eukprot:4806349-Amphidinium_carterae.2
MEHEMERLWAKKMQAYGPVPFNRNAAIAAILRIAFKAAGDPIIDREETPLNFKFPFGLGVLLSAFLSRSMITLQSSRHWHPAHDQCQSISVTSHAIRGVLGGSIITDPQRRQDGIARRPCCLPKAYPEV